MLTDTDDDFFFEEDKIFDITPISMDPKESVVAEKIPTGELIALSSDELGYVEPTNTTTTNELITLPSDDTIPVPKDEQPETNPETEASCNLVDDNLQSTDVTATIVYTATSFESDKFSDTLYKQKFELERLGMTVSTKSVVVIKDDTNLIGISIGGGAPLCPCLYIVQVFDGTPAAREGSLESGDELLAINSTSVKGKTKVQVAKMIQAASQQVTIHYNKLHADPERGKSLDIILKKLKHRIVDNMSSNTADTLGLSRAILCNDSLVKRLEELEGTEMMYKGLVEHARRMLKAYYDLLQSYRLFGDCFMRISTREPQMRASEAFRMFGEFHRNLEKDGLVVIKQIKPILDDLGTYLHKAIPDTKLTVKRYMDAKFTYLSYCLKVKEMDDEEHGFASIQEPLYRVETGNYEYRLILRCRQDARTKFAKLRTDVLEKMELLECKHANDLTKQLRSLLDCMAQLNQSIVDRMEALPNLFPIEVDFKETDFQYKSKILEPQKLDDDEEEELQQQQQYQRQGISKTSKNMGDVVCGLEAVEKPATIINVPAVKAQEQVILSLLDNPSDNLLDVPTTSSTTTSLVTNESDQLLKDLGLLGIDLNASPLNATATNTQNIAASSNGAYDFDLFLNQKTSSATATSQLEKDLMACNALETDLLLQ
ncbi:PRKCA-binding protein-like isoform X1 [Haematobia irritans]|uniref:PRKCA-binding protein-like isoform X1 n=1 Tax=Haematobia irritans TaxID=7368 RepID=UPI003F507ED3